MIVGKDLRDVCVVCAAPGSMIGSVQAEYNPFISHPSSAETSFKADVLCQLPSTIMEPAAQCRHSLCRMIDKNNNWGIKASGHFSGRFRIGMNALAVSSSFRFPQKHKNASQQTYFIEFSFQVCGTRHMLSVCTNWVFPKISMILSMPQNHRFPCWKWQFWMISGSPMLGSPNGDCNVQLVQLCSGVLPLEQ